MTGLRQIASNGNLHFLTDYLPRTLRHMLCLQWETMERGAEASSLCTKPFRCLRKIRLGSGRCMLLQSGASYLLLSVRCGGGRARASVLLVLCGELHLTHVFPSPPLHIADGFLRVHPLDHLTKPVAVFIEQRGCASFSVSVSLGMIAINTRTGVQILSWTGPLHAPGHAPTVAAGSLRDVTSLSGLPSDGGVRDWFAPLRTYSLDPVLPSRGTAGTAGGAAGGGGGAAAGAGAGESGIAAAARKRRNSAGNLLLALAAAAAASASPAAAAVSCMTWVGPLLVLGVIRRRDAQLVRDREGIDGDGAGDAARRSSVGRLSTAGSEAGPSATSLHLVRDAAVPSSAAAGPSGSVSETAPEPADTGYRLTYLFLHPWTGQVMHEVQGGVAPPLDSAGVPSAVLPPPPEPGSGFPPSAASAVDAALSLLGASSLAAPPPATATAAASPALTPGGGLNYSWGGAAVTHETIAQSQRLARALLEAKGGDGDGDNDFDSLPPRRDTILGHEAESGYGYGYGESDGDDDGGRLRRSYSGGGGSSRGRRLRDRSGSDASLASVDDGDREGGDADREAEEAGSFLLLAVGTPQPAPSAASLAASRAGSSGSDLAAAAAAAAAAPALAVVPPVRGLVAAGITIEGSAGYRLSAPGASAAAFSAAVGSGSASSSSSAIAGSSAAGSRGNDLSFSGSAGGGSSRLSLHRPPLAFTALPYALHASPCFPYLIAVQHGGIDIVNTSLGRAVQHLRLPHALGVAACPAAHAARLTVVAHGYRLATAAAAAAAHSGGGSGGGAAGHAMASHQSPAYAASLAWAEGLSPATAESLRAAIATPERIFVFARTGVIMLRMVPVVMQVAALLSQRPPLFEPAIALCDHFRAIKEGAALLTSALASHHARAGGSGGGTGTGSGGGIDRTASGNSLSSMALTTTTAASVAVPGPAMSMTGHSHGRPSKTSFSARSGASVGGGLDKLGQATGSPSPAPAPAALSLDALGGVNELKIRQIRAQFGYRLFARADYAPALAHLLHAREPVRRVLSLFPQLLPARERAAAIATARASGISLRAGAAVGSAAAVQAQFFPVAMPVMIDAMLPAAVRALIPFLIAHRRRLRCHTEAPDLTLSEDDALSPDDVVSAIDMAAAAVVPDGDRERDRDGAYDDGDGDGDAASEDGPAVAAEGVADQAGAAASAADEASADLAQSPAASSASAAAIAATREQSERRRHGTARFRDAASLALAVQLPEPARGSGSSSSSSSASSSSLSSSSASGPMLPAVLVDTMLLTCLLWLEGFYTSCMTAAIASGSGASGSASAGDAGTAAVSHAASQLRRVRGATMRHLLGRNVIDLPEAELQLRAFGKDGSPEHVALYRSRGMHAQAAALLRSRLADALAVVGPQPLNDPLSLDAQLRTHCGREIDSHSDAAMGRGGPAEAATAATLQRLLLFAACLADLPVSHECEPLLHDGAAWLLSGVAGLTGVLLALRLLMLRTPLPLPASCGLGVFGSVMPVHGGSEAAVAHGHAAAALLAPMQASLQLITTAAARAAPSFTRQIAQLGLAADATSASIPSDAVYSANLVGWLTPILAASDAEASTAAEVSGDSAAQLSALASAAAAGRPALLMLQATLLEHVDLSISQHAASCTACGSGSAAFALAPAGAANASSTACLAAAGVRDALVRALVALISFAAFANASAGAAASAVPSIAPTGKVKGAEHAPHQQRVLSAAAWLPADRCTGILGSLRRRLLRALRRPGALDAAWLLQNLPFAAAPALASGAGTAPAAAPAASQSASLPPLLEERVEALRRMGRHEEALALVVAAGRAWGDAGAALRYCEQALEESSSSSAGPASASGYGSGSGVGLDLADASEAADSAAVAQRGVGSSGSALLAPRRGEVASVFGALMRASLEGVPRRPEDAPSSGLDAAVEAEAAAAAASAAAAGAGAQQSTALAADGAAVRVATIGGAGSEAAAGASGAESSAGIVLHKKPAAGGARQHFGLARLLAASRIPATAVAAALGESAAEPASAPGIDGHAAAAPQPAAAATPTSASASASTATATAATDAAPAPASAASVDEAVAAMLPFLLRHHAQLDASRTLAALPDEVSLAVVAPLLLAALSHEAATARACTAGAALGSVAALQSRLREGEVKAALAVGLDARSACWACGEPLVGPSPGQGIGGVPEPFARDPSGKLFHPRCWRAGAADAPRARRRDRERERERERYGEHEERSGGHGARRKEGDDVAAGERGGDRKQLRAAAEASSVSSSAPTSRGNPFTASRTPGAGLAGSSGTGAGRR